MSSKPRPLKHKEYAKAKSRFRAKGASGESVLVPSAGPQYFEGFLEAKPDKNRQRQNEAKGLGELPQNK